jgi:NAD(P)-dependent dehydrogenase (short-subunit alcohol dehydrogenase family)
MTPKRLEGKVAVVTGGTERIGWAAARLFARDGAYVFITGRRQKELDEAAKAIGSNVSGVQGDVAKLADLDRLYETVAEVMGRIDIVFANAGHRSTHRGIRASGSSSARVGCTGVCRQRNRLGASGVRRMGERIQIDHFRIMVVRMIVADQHKCV